MSEECCPHWKNLLYLKGKRSKSSGCLAISAISLTFAALHMHRTFFTSRDERCPSILSEAINSAIRQSLFAWHEKAIKISIQPKLHGNLLRNRLLRLWRNYSIMRSNQHRMHQEAFGEWIKFCSKSITLPSNIKWLRGLLLAIRQSEHDKTSFSSINGHTTENQQLIYNEQQDQRRSWYLCDCFYIDWILYYAWNTLLDHLSTAPISHQYTCCAHVQYLCVHHVDLSDPIWNVRA